MEIKRKSDEVTKAMVLFRYNYKCVKLVDLGKSREEKRREFFIGQTRWDT